MFKSNVIRTGFLFLGVALLSACGSVMRPGATGGFFNAPDNQTQPNVGGGGGPVVEPFKITFFATHEIYNGDLGNYATTGDGTKGRDGADTLCRMIPGYEDRQVHAVLSVTEDDQLKDMPTNFNFSKDAPIFGDKGLQIAKNWADLLDSLLDASLQSTVTELAEDGFYWTGSEADGSLSINNNCLGFESGDRSETGASGLASAKEYEWLIAKSNGCHSQQKVLCIAF